MYVIITFQYEKDLIKSDGEEMSSPFSHYYKSVGWFLTLKGPGQQFTPQKGVDQLCNYRTAYLRLCFHIYIAYSMQKNMFLLTQLIVFFKLKRK